MKNDAVKDNMVILIDNVIRNLVPVRGGDTETNIQFYDDMNCICHIQAENNFSYDFDEEYLDNLPKPDTYNNISVYTNFPEVDIVNQPILSDIALFSKEPNDFAKSLMYDYNRNHGEFLLNIIKDGDLPKDICDTSQAQYISGLDVRDMMTNSTELFTNIYMLENLIKDKCFEQYDDFLESLFLENGYASFGVQIEHTGLGITKIALSYSDTAGITQFFPITEMLTEEFYDHKTFVERITSAFNSYMKPYASMQLDGASEQESPAMV